MSVKRYTAKPSDLIEVENGYLVLHSDYAALLARHNALREAVAWERKCKEVWLIVRKDANDKAWNETTCFLRAARAAVDELVGEG